MYINHHEHHEHHRSKHIGWLRAAVLGANDGIISTSSLIVGVAAAHTSPSSLLVVGVAAIAAGAMSMAAGEYVSVSSQADTEKADLNTERRELEINRPAELKELTGIYIKRGLEPNLAAQVAEQLMEHDALAAHARDELGITAITVARPLQAAFSSAVCFTLGGIIPLAAIILAPTTILIPAIYGTAILSLGLLGGLAAKMGGASVGKGMGRVIFWGTLAMAVSTYIGSIFAPAI